MSKLKICFVGIGSIAKRHIKNLVIVCRERRIEIQIDAVRRKNSDKTEVDVYLTHVYYSIEEITNQYDIVFITNPTKFHLDTLEAWRGKAKHFFIEKPLADLSQINKIYKIKLDEGAIYYVACPLRYNAVIQYIKENINIQNVLSIRSISSSYLPGWRPGTDYTKTYSAHRELGGGVAIDLIHEWDYLTYIFGFPQKIYSMTGKISELDINSDDYAIYIAEYEHRIAELHLDYFGRKTIREIQLITKEDTIIGDIVNNKITFMKSGEKIEFKETRDDFQKRELNHFLDMIEGKIKSDNDVFNAAKVLKLAEGIE